MNRPRHLNVVSFAAGFVALTAVHCSCQSESGTPNEAATPATNEKKCTTAADCKNGEICNYLGQCIIQQPANTTDDESPVPAGDSDDVVSDDKKGRQECQSIYAAIWTLDEQCILPGGEFRPYPIATGYDVTGIPAPKVWPFSDSNSTVLATDLGKATADINAGFVAWIQLTPGTRPPNTPLYRTLRIYDLSRQQEWAFPARVDGPTTVSVAVADSSTIVWSGSILGDGDNSTRHHVSWWDLRENSGGQLLEKEGTDLALAFFGARNTVAAATATSNQQTTTLTHIDLSSKTSKQVPNVLEQATMPAVSKNAIYFTDVPSLPHPSKYALKRYDIAKMTTEIIFGPDDIEFYKNGDILFNRASPNGEWITSTLRLTAQDGVLLMHVPDRKWEIIPGVFGSTVTDHMLVYVAGEAAGDLSPVSNIVGRDLEDGHECILSDVSQYYTIPSAWNQYLLMYKNTGLTEIGALAVVDLAAKGITDENGKLKSDCGDPKRLRKPE